MESRAKWQAIREVRDAKVRYNMANPESELLAPNVTLVSKGRMDLGTALTHMKERFNRCRVSQTIIKADRKLVTKALMRKYRMNDADLYGELDGESYKPGSTIREKSASTSDQSLVRVGTTKPHLVRTGQTGDDGKPVVFRVPAKPKFRPVGAPDSVPKDGGVYPKAKPKK